MDTGGGPGAWFDIRVAQTEADFECVFQLNHRIFSDELKQHPPQPSGRLIDRFHHRNTYFMCLHQSHGPSPVGMVAITMPENGRFSVDEKVAHSHILDPFRAGGVEFRLLGVLQEYRRTTASWLLLREVAQEALNRGCRYGLISAIVHQTHLYTKLGFSSLGPAHTSGQAQFVPMVVELESYMAFARKHPRLMMPFAQGPTPSLSRGPTPGTLGKGGGTPQ